MPHAVGDCPQPLLAVVASIQDAHDPLRLWSVLSKSPDAIQDGRRLENMAWRLAWREAQRPVQVWPPTPESISSDDSGGPFQLAPRRRVTAGKVIYDMISPGLTKKLVDPRKPGYPTPTSSSSSCASSMAVQETDVVVPRVVILTPTPNLSPHPTPPATPLLTNASPTRTPSPVALLPPVLPELSPSTQQRKDLPLFLSRSATRGMGSPVFPATSAYAAQSTHILPLGGRSAKTPRGPTKFFLQAGASASSHSSSHSSGRSSGSSESSRERERRGEELKERQAYLGDTRGRGRASRAANGDDLEISKTQTQQIKSAVSDAPDKLQTAAKTPIQQPQEQQPAKPPLKQTHGKPPPRTVSAPFLGMESTSRPQMDVDDARSVSSHATSSSNAKMRTARTKQPRALTTRGQRQQHSRSRSRKEGSNSKNAATNDLGLPSNLAAAVAFVESGKRRTTTIVLATSDEDEDSEWSDDEDVSREGEQEEEKEEPAEDQEEEGADEEDEEWEDESQSPSQGISAEKHPPADTKAPPPSLQQQPPALHRPGHSRGNSTGGGPPELRHLPTRPTHRSTGHLPGLGRPNQLTRHHRHMSERTLKDANTLSTLESAALEAQRQRDLFAKVPRVSYENLTQLAASRPSNLTLLLGGRQVAEPHQQVTIPHRQRPAGGFGGLGLAMTSHPPVAGHGGAQLSPIPPTPATALEPTTRQPQPPVAPPTRPNMPRAKSSSALPPHFSAANSSLGKSPAAHPVVTAPVGSTQNSSAGRNGYRPKGPPAEAEFDDDDESDADGRGKGKDRTSDDGLQLSKSVAHEKLRLLAERSDIHSRAKNGADPTAERRRLYEQAGVPEWATSTSPEPITAPTNPQPSRPTSAAPVGFPYYLPPPAPPSTPRTTRQQMLRNEMSESLRHNLLWHRKQSRTELSGPQPRRTKSTVHIPTAEKSLVRLTPRPPGAERREPLMDHPPVLEGAQKKKLLRNLSWADSSDFHRTGW